MTALVSDTAGKGMSGGRFGEIYWWQGAGQQHMPVPPAAGQANDEDYRAIVDNLPTLCWIADADGYITWYNRRWHEYCGTTPEQMEGWGWKSVHDPAVLPTVMAGWTGSIASGEPFEMTFPLRGADGVFRPFLTRIIPLRDAAGVVRRWIGNNIDVSRQAAVERKLRQARGARGSEPPAGGARGVPVERARQFDRLYQGARPGRAAELSDFFEDAGWRVFAAADADEAIAILDQRKDVRVVLTDVQMPGSMDGLRLAHHIRERFPPTVLFVVSGGTPIGHDALPPRTTFLPKPFDPHWLLRQIDNDRS